MNKNDKCGIAPLADLDVQEIDKELLIKVLSKPENQAKIMEINQRIAKELNLRTDENSTITPDATVIDKNEEFQSQNENIDNEQKNKES